MNEFDKDRTSKLWKSKLSELFGELDTPLSVNRAAPEDIAPWISRFDAVKIMMPEGAEVSCHLGQDQTFLRLVMDGRWTVKTIDGEHSFENTVVELGSHTKHLPITCSGNIMFCSIGLKAGALYALTGRHAHTMTDRVNADDLFDLLGPDFSGEFDPSKSPEQWVAATETAIRRYIKRTNPPYPNPISAAFEIASYRDPSIPLREFAKSQNIGLRQLERLTKRDFGLTPRSVMRRAKVLDAAAQLLGVADKAEADEMMLRYFDQSHLIRDFVNFFGMTPKKFRASPQPFIMVSLEQRQIRRLEELNRYRPDEKMPWA